jgi:NADP-dependent 3-hydroxy acid dehydrogenase YdfG
MPEMPPKHGTAARRLALVTGASRGVGAAIARRLARTHDIYLGARTPAALAQLVDQLPGARPWPVDLTDYAAVSQATAGVDQLDALVHCAGVATGGRIADLSVQDWRHIMEIDVIAVAELPRLLLPALRSTGGHVILINSIVGRKAPPGWSAYAAGKFALRALADALREEEPSIRVTSVYPGRIDTDMQRAIVAAENRTYRREEFLDPVTVARAVGELIDTTVDAHPTDLTLWHRPRGRGARYLAGDPRPRTAGGGA